ncbi:MAG: MotA/TolQ/ExbB proton channel family protein [Bacteriovoracia bacterium]
MIVKVLGFTIVVACLTIVFLFETSSSATGGFRLLHWPAIILTGFGPFGVVLLCSTWGRIQMVVSLLKKSASQIQKRQEIESDFLQALSSKYYIQGARALTEARTDVLSSYVQKAIDRLSIRIPVQDVRDLIERDLDKVEVRYQQSLSLVGLGLKLAPSVGMLGTILGMVQLLSSLKDPSHIGSHMSLALLTTFYGLFFSLIVWTPTQHRLEAIRDAELDGYQKVIHWLELLEKRKPAHYFSDTLDEPNLTVEKV